MERFTTAQYVTKTVQEFAKTEVMKLSDELPIDPYSWPIEQQREYNRAAYLNDLETFEMHEDAIMGPVHSITSQ